MKKLVTLLIFASLLACSKQETEVLPQPNVVIYTSGGSYEIHIGSRTARPSASTMVPNCNSAASDKFVRFYLPTGVYSYSIYKETVGHLDLMREGSVTIKTGCNVLDLSRAGAWSDK